MNPYQKDVYRLHALGIFSPPPPEPPTLNAYPFELRASLILEESMEYLKASGCALIVDPMDMETGTAIAKTGPHDHAQMVDALIDILVVTYGAAVSMGLDLDPFWDEVQRTNAAKIEGPIRADGKRLKPEGWTPPDIKGLLTSILAKK